MRFSLVMVYDKDTAVARAGEFVEVGNLTMHKAKELFDKFVAKPLPAVGTVKVLDPDDKLCIMWQRGKGVLIHPALRELPQ